MPGIAASDDGLNWTGFGGPYNGAALELLELGEWDSLMMGWPHAIRVELGDGNSEYRMYYHATTFSEFKFGPGIARSDDDFVWGKFRFFEELPPGLEGSFDEQGNSNNRVVYFVPDDEFVMFFETSIGKGGSAWRSTRMTSTTGLSTSVAISSSQVERFFSTRG